MYQNLKKRTEGFTIIEVLIVLAIAGLIMLIVFLAVPALQRNSRNNARNNDASRIASAITECLANRNNQTTACDDGFGGDGEQIETLAGTLSQLTTVQYVGGYIDGATGNTSTAQFGFGFECNAAGDDAVGGATATTFAVRFQIEDGINRCISG